MNIDTPTSRHKIMAAIHSKNTKIEIRLRRALWHKGVRYRKNFKVCGCRVDIAITKYKIAVFCDGEFWHGKKKRKILTNVEYWEEKIRRNIERDLDNTISLRDNGWEVLRFWETDIEKHLDQCVAEVISKIHEWQYFHNQGRNHLQ